MNEYFPYSFEKTEAGWQKKLNKKDSLSSNLATKKGYCTQQLHKRNKKKYLNNK
jgi:alanine dehydrogenase